MKKIYSFFLCVVILISTLLYGCQSNNNSDGPSNDNAITDGSIDTGPRQFETIIYDEIEGPAIFHESEKQYEKFEAREYKENISKNQIIIDVLGTKYTGTYSNTAKLPRSDTQVYVYELEGTDGGSVFVDTKTNAILEYSAVPYHENLITESDYIDFIKQMLGNNRTLNEYDYECKTHYYSKRPQEFRSQVVDGFRVCGENEKIGTYYFYYTKSSNGIELPGHISAAFFGGMFILEIYEYDYENTKFSSVLDRMGEAEESIENHLKSKIKDGHNILSIEHGSRSLFVQDGIVYISVKSTITYTTKDSSEPYSVYIETITG